MGLPGAARVRHDRLTFALFATYLTWGWFLYSLSPAVPLIAADLGISRGVAGLHGTALAVGTLIAGLISERLTMAIGRRGQMLVGAGTVSAGVLLLVTGPGLPATLSACVVAAIGGNLTLAASQPALLAHQGTAGPAAVTEGNGYATSVGLLAPLVLGTTVAAGLGWRPAILATVLAAGAAAVMLLGVPAVGPIGRPAAPAQPAPDAPPPGRLTARYWLLWIATVAGVAIEFATTFWASDLVIAQTGASASVATGAIAALLAGMTVSRFATGWLALRYPPESLLLTSYAVAATGWLVLWLATTPVVAVVGLAVAGLGYGLHYPLGIALTLTAAGDLADRGAARAILGTGAAVGLAPFVLGGAADLVGPHAAFLMVPLLVAVAAAAVLGTRTTHR